MKLRKHVRADILRRISEEALLGVPIARSMNKHIPAGEITRPTVVMLLDALALVQSVEGVDLDVADRLVNSLFPVWLDSTGPAVQEQPYLYDYVGTFPQGKYVCRT